MCGQVDCIRAHHDSLLADCPIAVEREEICAADHAGWQSAWVTTRELFAPFDVALAPNPRKQCVAPTARIREDEGLRVEPTHPKIVGNVEPSVTLPLDAVRAVRD